MMLHTAGREPDRDRFCSGTIFCDAASGYIHVEHQASLSAKDSILAKEAFEQVAMDHGLTTTSLQTNGKGLMVPWWANGTIQTNRGTVGTE